jgi:hypothetical protein
MIQLNLPLSATALREGAEFLTKLSQLADVIRDEVRGPACTSLGTLSYTVDVDTTGATEKLEALASLAPAGGDHDKPLNAAGGSVNDAFAQDVAIAEAATVAPVQYEPVVVGHERNPEYTGELAAYDHAALTAAGWTDAALLENGYLCEVIEQRPLAVATVAPAAPAPSAPPAPAAAPGTDTVELDADGLPWDARIHSDATERKAKTGKWKTRKNLPDGYKEQIEAELRGVPVTPATPAPAPAPSAPSPAATAAPAPTPPTAGGMTFAEFTRWVLGHTQAQRCNQTDVQLAVQAAGLSSIPDLAKRTDLISTVVDSLKASKGLQ